MDDLSGGSTYNRFTLDMSLFGLGIIVERWCCNRIFRAVQNNSMACEMSIVRLCVVVALLRCDRGTIARQPAIAIIISGMRFHIIYKAITMERIAWLSHDDMLRSGENLGQAVIAGTHRRQADVACATVHLHMPHRIESIRNLVEEGTVTRKSVVLEAKPDIALGNLHAGTSGLVEFQVVGMIKIYPLGFLLSLSLTTALSIGLLG